MKIGLIVVVSVAGVLVLLVALRSMIRRSLNAVSDDPELAGALLTTPGNMPGGQRSSGTSVGGMGILAVHRSHLTFVRVMPRRAFHIQRRAINAVTIERALRAPGRYLRARQPVLMVRWDDDGVARQVGFFVRDPQAVLAEIERDTGHDR